MTRPAFIMRCIPGLPRDMYVLDPALKAHVDETEELEHAARELFRGLWEPRPSDSEKQST